MPTGGKGGKSRREFLDVIVEVALYPSVPCSAWHGRSLLLPSPNCSAPVTYLQELQFTPLQNSGNFWLPNHGSHQLGQGLVSSTFAHNNPEQHVLYRTGETTYAPLQHYAASSPNSFYYSPATNLDPSLASFPPSEPCQFTEISLDAMQSSQLLGISPYSLSAPSARTSGVPLYVSLSDVIEAVQAILDKVSVKPKPSYVSCRYAKDDPRSHQGNYMMPYDRPTARNCQRSEELRRIRQIVAILPKTLDELRTITNVPIDMDGGTLFDTLTDLKESKSYQSWVFTSRGAGIKSGKRGTRAAQRKTEDQIQRRLAADTRSIHKRKIRGHFLDLLWLIEDWAKQVKLPDIDSERRAHLRMIYIEMSKTIKVIQTRFAETLPWTSFV